MATTNKTRQDKDLLQHMIEQRGVQYVVEALAEICFDKAREGDISDPDDESHYFQRDGEILQDTLKHLYSR